MSDWIENGPADAALCLILAHGAGAAMDTPFMQRIGEGLGDAGYRVVRFEFPYMHRSREEGRKRPPDREAVLLDHWRETVAAVRAQHAGAVAIGGKSMGGRMASLVADELDVAGLLVLGYPFHPPGKPDRPRVAHLAGITTPTLILQGERDPFGRPEEVAGYDLSDRIEVAWLADGDHGFKPRKRSGLTESENLTEAVERAAAFLRNLTAGSGL